MNFYTIMSKMYDVLEFTYFSNKEKNPRTAINKLISNKNINILDLCCGTMANSIPIAKSRKNAKILGVDISKQMLKVADEKIKKEKLDNVNIKYCDATSTYLKSESFDYIIIGLVLHEMNPQLQRKVLAEAYRLLKQDGRLIILEWEKSQSVIQKILYFPLLMLEQAICKSFLDFYNCDKKAFFEENNFYTCNVDHCSYSVVMELKKQK